MRYLNKNLTDAEVLRDGGAHCKDCGWNIMRGDDDALICIDCGGRNRLIYKRRWTYGIYLSLIVLLLVVASVAIRTLCD